MPYEQHDPERGCGLMIVTAAFAVLVVAVIVVLFLTGVLRLP